MRNTARRGAAMVEGAVVMPVIVLFYGLMAFVYSEYEVKQALVARHKVTASRLMTDGFGASRPKDTNTTLEGRARNRRVEVVVTSDVSLAPVLEPDA